MAASRVTDTAAVNQAIPLWDIAHRDTTLQRVSSTHGGEDSGPCPFCGGDDRFSVQRDRNGQCVWLCRHCTQAKWKDAIAYLMQRDSLSFRDVLRQYEDYKPPERRQVQPTVRQKPKPKQTPSWWHMPAGEFASRYMNDDAAALWRQYKPVTPAVVQKYRLGYGALPEPTRCRCPRLLLPIFDEADRLVCVRGRLLSECPCMEKPKKWLASGGFTLPQLPLYNNQRAGILVILENPVDAILMTENQAQAARWLRAGFPDMTQRLRDTMISSIKDGLPPIVGAATLSIYYWQPHWQPNARMVIVAFDNWLSGNGGANNRRRMVQEYLKDNPKRAVPESRGASLATEIGAYLYNWQGFGGKDYAEWIEEHEHA